jgi:CheY-like chemotaxis protein
MPAPDLTDSDNALAHLHDLLARHTKRLQILERKAATLGPINCPPEMEMEIEEIREQITELQRRANALTEQIRIQRRKLILICDPAIETADIFRRMLLRAFGDSYDLLSVFTGADVLTIVQFWPVALLLIASRSFERWDARDLITTLKAHAPGAAVIVVRDTFMEGQRDGVDYYLDRPVSLLELVDTVRQALDPTKNPPR